MWAFLKGIFGMPEVVKGAIDIVGKGTDMLDNAFYTDQEKAQNQNRFNETWLKLQMLWANDNSISAITRRMIAFFSYGVFFFLVIAMCIIWKFDENWALFIFKVITELYVAWIVVTITIAFFGFYGYGKYVSKENVPYTVLELKDKNCKEDK